MPSAIDKARAMLEGNARLTLADRERLLGYLEGTGRSILVEPEALLTATPKVPGLDGRKMSKSYGNTIGLREDPDEVAKKLKTMQTDPARVAAHRSGRSRQMSGLGSSQDLLGRRHSGLGAAGLPHGRHRLPGLQEAAGRPRRGGDHGDPRARAGIRRESRPGARHHRRRVREGARRGAPDARGSASGDGMTTSEHGEARTETGRKHRLAAGSGRARSELPPQQSEMPFAVVEGEPVTELPRDLYIPPDALQVFLEAFEGPLDLLLYLIRRQNLDILDIPIAEITRQYMKYIEVMADLQLELAGEYLLMAAMLAEIKSRMLLPRPPAADGQDEDDPRAELVRRLQEYERFKKAAEDIDRLTRLERDTLPASAELTERKVVKMCRR